MRTAELYNKVTDGRRKNLQACVAAALVPGNGTGAVHIRITAANGYGSVDLAVTRVGPGLEFGLAALDRWKVTAASNRIVAFAELWAGLIDDRSTAPLIMGKLQGPRGLRGLPPPTPSMSSASVTPSLSAGFLTLSSRGYYRYLFGCSEGDTVGFVLGPTDKIDADWLAVARVKHMLQNNPHRFASWCASAMMLAPSPWPRPAPPYWPPCCPVPVPKQCTCQRLCWVADG